MCSRGHRDICKRTSAQGPQVGRLFGSPHERGGVVFGELCTGAALGQEQRSEARNQRSGIREQGSDVGLRSTDDRGQKSKVRIIVSLQVEDERANRQPSIFHSSIFHISLQRDRSVCAAGVSLWDYEVGSRSDVALPAGSLNFADSFASSDGIHGVI